MGQLAAHVQVLAALAGEEHGHLAGGGAAAPEDPLRLERLPGGGAAQPRRLGGLGQLLVQIGPVGEVHQQALGGVQVGGCGQGQRRRPAARDLAQRRGDPRVEVGGRGGAEGQDAAQGRGRRHGGLGTLAGGGRAGEASVCLRLSPDHPRHIFLQNQMKVGAAEAVGADPGAARRVTPALPRRSLVDEAERAGGEVDVRVRALGVERGRQHLLVNREDRLEHAGRAGPGLQVADIALGRAEPDAAALGRPKDFR